MEATDGAPSLVAAEAAGKLRPAVLRRFAPLPLEGLGPRRPSSASVALPAATHALFVDPDWRPRRATAGALESAAATGKTVLAFRVRDRNGRTERLLDWCFAMDGGAYVKYRAATKTRSPPPRPPPRRPRARAFYDRAPCGDDAPLAAAAAAAAVPAPRAAPRPRAAAAAAGCGDAAETPPEPPPDRQAASSRTSRGLRGAPRPARCARRPCSGATAPRRPTRP
ncbi:hypothetical protein JL721_12027 [Aureococcus anophagefferens]|nr:hypothetical protein JL721_12027 [Aureococcus anophagefferens]